MKKQLLFLLFCCLAISAVQAQTITWTGAADVNYSNPANWNPAQVPTAINDVIVPPGSTMTINVAASVKSIEVRGTSTITVANQLSFTNASSFSSNTTTIFSGGNLRGGGTLTNNGTINITTTSTKTIYDNTVLKNNGTINLMGVCQLEIRDGTINNESTGIIDLQTEGSSISYYYGARHELNNYGLIKRTSTGNVTIAVLLHNDGGTIDVQMGELTLDRDSIKFTNGIYNVSTDATLTWANTITFEGTLTGALNGQINWNSTVNVPVEATFNFSGATGIYWNSGNLNGGGTLINQDKITLLTETVKYIYGNSNFNNEGDFNFESNNQVYIRDGIFNNQSSGVIDFRFDGANFGYYYGATHILNNYGLIKQTSEGTGTISTVLNNNNGIISVEDGILNLNDLSKNLNDGTYNVMTGASMEWNSQVVPSGVLEGSLNGPIAWNNQVYIAAEASATFNFTGSIGIHWNSGNLAGGGTLINQSKLTTLTSGIKYIYDNSYLNNEDSFFIESDGQIYIYDGFFTNQTSGEIDLRNDGANFGYYYGNTHVLNNYGLIKQSSEGTGTISTVLNNYDGTITVNDGTLILNGLPKYFNDGTYTVKSAASMQWNSQVVPLGTLAGALNGPINWNDQVYIPTESSATFNFSGSSGVNWNSGKLAGGGTLINQSELTLLSAAEKRIYDNSNLNNAGLINIEDVGSLYLWDGYVNNQASGVIDLRVDGAIINYYYGNTHVLNNSGLIKQTSPGTGYIDVLLNNNNGTISVESGFLDFRTLSKNLNDGIYNVASGASILWDTQIVLSGTLTGNLSSPIYWNNDVNVPASTTANFNFTGIAGIKWNSGNLNGGGTLNNNSKITLISSQTKFVKDNTIFNNEGVLNFEEVGQLYIYDGILNNQTSGVIDFKVDDTGISYYYGNMHIFNNLGLLKKSAGSGTATIATNQNTNSGTIDVQSGTLNFQDGNSLVNTEDGIIKGIGTIDIPEPSKFTNDGAFAPGGSPGILTVLGTYISSSTSVLEVEINGLAAGTEYDQLVITGSNAVFEGTVDIDLGFEANVGDSFTIATVNGVIATKNLVSPVYSVGGCREYTFAITYPNDNSVVLTVTNKGDVQPPEVNTQDITVQLDVNGTVSITPEQIDNGSTAGCTEGGELTFSLDKTDFTCDDLGNNTVTLTVSDENGNYASGTATVTVEDDLSPTVMVQNLSVELNASGVATISPADIDTGSFDNCTIAIQSLDINSFSCSNIGGNQVIFTAEDQSGNVSTATVTVTVSDPLGACNEAPIAVCQAVFVDSNDNCQANATAQAFDGGSTDPNGLPLTYTVDPIGPYNVGITDVTLTVSNGSDSSSCTTTITVVDNTPPVANCAAPFTVELDASGNASISVSDIDNGSSDNCGIATKSIDKTDFNCGDIGENPITLTITDISGHESNCSTVVTVSDPLGSCTGTPVAVCQALSLDADSGCSANATAMDFDGGSYDPNGASLTFTVDPVGPYNVGVTNVTLTVSNGTNSASCTTTITVLDETPPVANCAAPFTVQLDANGNVNISISDIENGSTDNCGIASTSIDVMDFSCSEIGENTVTLTVTDLSGNVSTCTTVVIVEDTLAPTVLVQDITVSLDSSGNVSITAGDIDNGSYDNCSIASMDLDIYSFTCSNIGINTVTLSVTDASGNIGTADAVVTVEDPLDSCTSDGCGEENPTDFSFETGYNCSSQAEMYKTANDLTVAANEKFTLENISSTFFVQGSVTNVDVYYYANDVTGFPGMQIGSQTSVTIEDQTVIGNGLGYDIVEVEMAVDPYTFLGQSGTTTTYWIQLVVTNSYNGNDIFWLMTSSSMKGLPTAFYNGGWTYPEPGMDGVYKWEGTCEPMDGTVCAAPSGLTVNTVMAYTADISWQAGGSETNWIVQYGAPGFDPNLEGTSVLVSGTPETVLNSLSPNTSYEVYVKTDCGAQQSNFVGPVSFTTSSDSAAAFITTWQTTVSNESITIPTTGTGYSYSVDWGDGQTGNGYTGDATHVYSAPGTYTVSINGSFPRIYLNNTAVDRMKLKSIEQWGTQAWQSMNGAFAGAVNLVSNATDMPDLSMVTDMYGMFAYARKFNGDSAMGNWDVANVTNMYGMFAGASVFNADIKGWNVGNVNTMENMFYGATLFNRNLSDWNVSNVTNMKFMFATAMKFNGIITNWDVSNVMDMNSMFYHANSFDQDLGNWDVSNVTNMNNMFKNVILSTYNYDSILMGWSILPLKNNVRFNAGFSKYCAGEDARRYIIDIYNWSITDGGMDCGIPVRENTGAGQELYTLELYPNPMKGHLTLGNPDRLELRSLSIYDLTGRLVKKVDLRGMTAENTIDVSKLSSATYIIIIEGPAGSRTELLIKE